MPDTVEHNSFGDAGAVDTPPITSCALSWVRWRWAEAVACCGLWERPTGSEQHLQLDVQLHKEAHCGQNVTQRVHISMGNVHAVLWPHDDTSDLWLFVATGTQGKC